MNQERLRYLLQRCYDQSATTREREEFLKLVSLPENEEAVNELLKETFVAGADADQPDEETSRAMLVAIFEAQVKHEAVTHPIRKVHFLKAAWVKYAAAIIIICGVGAYLWTANKKQEQIIADNNGNAQTDILPGGNKAVLTLADGSNIILDSAADGNLAQQGNAQVVKLANGQIAYRLKGLEEKDIMMNTITTPKGGQYQITLPDGSQVWLNAASSIQFPAAFVGPTRKVKITGEAYFEIAKNKEKPFIVDIQGRTTVQALGTGFNVNSYEDEGVIKATLVEGSVKVANGNQHTILTPGQQAQINATVKVVNANIEQTIAWKNGIFNFNGLSLRAVMAQLARWYDIDVLYEGAVPGDTFKGEMYRSEKLSFVLGMLKDMGIKCKVEGKTVIVL